MKETCQCTKVICNCVNVNCHYQTVKLKSVNVKCNCVNVKYNCVNVFCHCVNVKRLCYAGICPSLSTKERCLTLKNHCLPVSYKFFLVGATRPVEYSRQRPVALRRRQAGCSNLQEVSSRFCKTTC